MGKGAILRFLPHRAAGRRWRWNLEWPIGEEGVGPQETKILSDFNKICQYNRTAQILPSHDFYEIIRACGRLHSWWRVKIWYDSLRRFQSYGGLKLRVFTVRVLQIFSALASKLCVGSQNVLQMQECAWGPLYHHVRVGGVGANWKLSGWVQQAGGFAAIRHCLQFLVSICQLMIFQKFFSTVQEKILLSIALSVIWR